MFRVLLFFTLVNSCFCISVPHNHTLDLSAEQLVHDFPLTCSRRPVLHKRDSELNLWTNGKIRFVFFDSKQKLVDPDFFSCSVDSLKKGISKMNKIIKRFDSRYEEFLTTFMKTVAVFNQQMKGSVQFEYVDLRDNMKSALQIVKSLESRQEQVMFVVLEQFPRHRMNAAADSQIGMIQMSHSQHQLSGFGYMGINEHILHEPESWSRIIMHELTHVAGQDHQFQRDDRDSYLFNVDGQSFPISRITKNIGQFDYFSVTNYQLSKLGPKKETALGPKQQSAHLINSEIFKVFLNVYNTTGQHVYEKFGTFDRLSDCDRYKFYRMYADSTQANFLDFSRQKCFYYDRFA